MTQPDPHVAPAPVSAEGTASGRRRGVSLLLIGGFVVAAGLGTGVTLALQHGSAPAGGAAVAAVTPSADGPPQPAVAGGGAADTAGPTVDGATLDDRFLTVLRMAGISPSADGGSTTISDAQGLCILFDQGHVPEQMGALLMRGGLTDRESRIFVGASVAAYCPRHLAAVKPYADGS